MLTRKKRKRKKESSLGGGGGGRRAGETFCAHCKPLALWPVVCDVACAIVGVYICPDGQRTRLGPFRLWDRGIETKISSTALFVFHLSPGVKKKKKGKAECTAAAPWPAMLRNGSAPTGESSRISSTYRTPHLL